MGTSAGTTVPADYRPDKAPWSNVELLLAALKDEVRLQTNVAISAAGGKPPEFKPTPRPGVTPSGASRSGGMTDEQRRAIDPRLRNQTQEAQ